MSEQRDTAARPASNEQSTRKEIAVRAILKSSVIHASVLLLFVLALGVGVLAVPSELAAQQGPGSTLASQSMRPYAHVFWAYALAWVIILGWIVTIARRWGRVEKDLGDASGGS